MKAKHKDMKINLDSLGMRVLFQSEGRKYRLDVYCDRSELKDGITREMIKKYTHPTSIETILNDCMDYKDNRESLE